MDLTCGLCDRHAICAGKRRSSATERCPSARTASITRPSVSSRRWRKSAIRRKGKQLLNSGPRAIAIDSERSAKYIEGLENRLGRMEALLRLSGLLSDEDGGKTDLGTLEKRLADRSAAVSSTHSSKHSNRSSPNASSVTTASHHATPKADAQSSPRSAEPSPTEKHDDEVEDLSDLMCSLVTNNAGETRYIGRI